MHPHKIYQDFRDWSHSPGVECEGTGITKEATTEKRVFVPVEAQREYWTTSRLKDLCFYLDISLQSDTILDNLISILSTLLDTSDPECRRISYRICRLHEDSYSDNKLPLTLEQIKKSAAFSSYPKEDAVAFYEAQFRYKPAIFGNPLWDSVQMPECVLPLKFDTQLQKGSRSSPTVNRYTLYRGREHVQNSHLVLKIVPKNSLPDFDAEKELFKEIRGLDENGYDCPRPPSEYFVACPGSFKQNECGVLVLENADGGSLEDYFSNNSPPYTYEGLVNLYGALNDLFRAIYCLTNTEHKKSYVHQDIKPSNIFVFYKPTKGGPDACYSFRPLQLKLGDFGMSSKAHLRDGFDLAARDSKSTKAYGAPELVVLDRPIGQLSQLVTEHTDMWSAACVVIDTVLWAVGGSAARAEFLRAREAEIKAQHQEMYNSGYGMAFHNTESPLDAVRNAIQRAILSRRTFDDMADPLLTLVSDEVLSPCHAKQRARAQHVLARIERIIDHSRKLHKERPSGALCRPRSSDALWAPGAERRTSASHNQHRSRSPRNVLPGRSLPGNEKILLSPWSTASQTAQSSSSSTLALTGSDFLIQTTVTTSDSLPEPPHPATAGTHLDTNGHSGNHLHFNADNRRNSAVRFARSDPPATPADFTAEIEGFQSNPPAVMRLNTDRTIRRQPWPNKSPTVTANYINEHRKHRGSIYTKLISKQAPDCHIEDLLESASAELTKRDQIFLIDDNQSLTGIWINVRRTLKALVYVVKRTDPVGIEVRFASQPDKVHCIKHMSDIQKVMKGRAANKKGKTMGEAIRVVFADVIAKKKRPGLGLHSLRTSPNGANIYVLTDGVWGMEKRPGMPDGGVYCLDVDKHIRKFIADMQACNLTRVYAAVQFVSFGNNAVGLERLGYLDDKLHERTIEGTLDELWDIVDTKAHTKPIWSILMGALDATNDAKTSHDETVGTMG